MAITMKGRPTIRANTPSNRAPRLIEPWVLEPWGVGGISEFSR
jgi:hypothetical protein